jgi:hypothetical protein
MIDWKRKLAAYLHHEPCKCAGIGMYEERSESALTTTGFLEEGLRQAGGPHTIALIKP